MIAFSSKDILPFLIVMAVAASLRLAYLEKIPGFEYDEGQATRLAKIAVQEPRFLLTGEKIYRGPVLEWLIALLFKVFGVSLFVARLPLALAGIVTVGLVYVLCLYRWERVTAFGAALLLAVHPWSLATSRVVHSACLVPFFLALFLYSLQKPSNTRKALFSGIVLSFAAHGHLYCLVLLVPLTMLYISEYLKDRRSVLSPWRYCGALGGGLIAGLLPLILYNVMEGWPTVRWFLSGSEGHLAGRIGFFQRLYGYLWSAYHSLNNEYFWLDAYDTFRGEGNVLLPIMFMLGLAWLVREVVVEQRVWSRFVLLWLIVSVLVVPQVTKHRQWEIGESNIFPSLPTYLDILYPLITIVCALGLRWLSSLRSVLRIGSLTAVVFFIFIALMQAHFVFEVGELFLDSSKAKAGFGRWQQNGAQAVAEHLNRQVTESDTILLNPVFGDIQPQVETLVHHKRFEYYLNRHNLPQPGRKTVVEKCFLVAKRSNVYNRQLIPALNTNEDKLASVLLSVTEIQDWLVIRYFRPLTLLGIENERWRLQIQSKIADGHAIHFGTIDLSSGFEYRLSDVQREVSYSERGVPTAGRTFMLKTDVDTLALLNNFVIKAIYKGKLIKLDSSEILGSFELVLKPSHDGYLYIFSCDGITELHQTGEAGYGDVTMW